MFCVKILDSRGNAYPQAPFEKEADARASFENSVYGSRFIKAELWSGSVDPKTQLWVDETRIDTRTL